jgi:hypothetical protein
MDIKYVVVKMDTSGTGVLEMERYEFDDVLGAIACHKEKKRSGYSESSYWDICIDYEDLDV